MRKLRIFEHISLDGVIQLPTGLPEIDADFPHGDWTARFRGPGGLELVLEAQGSTFDLLLGRTTYDVWSRYWPSAPKSPLADSINAATKYIGTHRPESLEWGPVEALGSNIVESTRKIKSEGGSDIILWGSSTLTSTLFAEGLVDEVVLVVYPILLGSGKRILSDQSLGRILSFVSSKATPNGVLLNTYKYVGEL